MSIPTAGARAFDLVPKYLETQLGQLFVLYIVPRHSNRPLRSVVVLPPFAEELNKSRQMLALLGQRLAEAGILYVLPDLYGTGDSEGNFEQASWRQWLSNVQSVVNALTNHAVASLDVVSLRSGAFLLPALEGSAFPLPGRIVFWNPVLRGAKLIDQLLRSRVIKDRSTANAASVARIRNEIEESGSMEVAGYCMRNDLVSAIDRLDLSKLELPRGSEVHWIDVAPIESNRVPPAVESVRRAWMSRPKSVSYTRVTGPQFWLGPEIDLVPELIDRTAEILSSAEQ